MSDPQIESEKPITLRELDDELKKIGNDESNFRVIKLQEYLNDFVKIKTKDEKALRKDIEALKIPRLKKEHICKIIDFLPETSDMIKLVLQQFPITISKENLNAICEVVKKYL